MSTPWNRKNRYSALSMPPVGSFTVSSANRRAEARNSPTNSGGRARQLRVIVGRHDPAAFRLIPVLGEGADPQKLPAFVQQQQYVDLRDRGRAPEQIRRLLEILSNPAASQASIPAGYWVEHIPSSDYPPDRTPLDGGDATPVKRASCRNSQMVQGMCRRPVKLSSSKPASLRRRR